jgi:TRAP-type C4-dicarboxylate transport system permease small subunit
VTTASPLHSAAGESGPRAFESLPSREGFSLYTRFCRRIARACMWLGITGMVLLICCISWQVFGRYVMNSTPTWAESLALLIVLWVTMLGMSVGVRDAGHIGLESFLVLAPEGVRMKMEILIHALILLFGLAMLWNCASLATSVWSYRLPTLGISEGWRYIPSSIAGVLVTLFSIEHLIALANGTEVEPAWS